MMRKITTTLAVGLMLALTGCNTVRGIGQDVQHAGETIEDSAKKKK